MQDDHNFELRMEPSVLVRRPSRIELGDLFLLTLWNRNF